jgi:hypothetical protein
MHGGMHQATGHETGLAFLTMTSTITKTKTKTRTSPPAAKDEKVGSGKGIELMKKPKKEAA